MSNMLDEDEVFRDNYDEEGGSQSVVNQQGYAMNQPEPKPYRAGRSTSSNTTPPQPEPEQNEVEEAVEQVEEEDVSSILSNARLRLEQGRLYEMIMNHNLFEGMDADLVAIKNVEKEIKKFAQQRMEIMLGMRQEEVKKESGSFPMESFPFNSMEVEVLKSLAAAATQGASRDAEPFSGEQAPPKRQTLNTIGGNVKPKTPAPIRNPAPIAKPTVGKPLQSRPAAPVKRPTVDETTQRILEEEGVTLDQINEVFDPNKKYLQRDDLENMSEEQFKNRSREVLKYNKKRVDNPSAIPMPSDQQMENIYAVKAQQAQAEIQNNPVMNKIMGLLNQRK